MAFSKNELTQAINGAFGSEQGRALLALVEYAEAFAADPANLPIATETTLGVMSVGTGLEVTAGGAVSGSA
jgi:hypothetical protein